MAAKEDKPRTESVPVEISDTVLELVERRLAERVEERVIASVNKYVRGAAAVAGVVGALLAVLGYKEISGLRGEAEKSRTEMAREAQSLKEQVTQFRDGDLPRYRDAMRRFAEREQQVRFSEPCASDPTVDQLQQWLQALKPPMSIRDDERTIFAAYLKDYNVCDAKQVQSILGHGIQKQLDAIYRRCLDRAPDLYGRLHWGVRLIRAWTEPEVREGVCESAEAQDRRKRAAAHPTQQQ